MKTALIDRIQVATEPAEDNKLKITGQLIVNGRGQAKPEDTAECIRLVQRGIIRLTMEAVIEAVDELKAALRQSDPAKVEEALARLDRALLGQL